MKDITTQKYWIDKDGYAIVGHTRVHRAVMEKFLKRKLLKDEIVHHKDHNKLNNDISNLELVEGHRNHKLQHHPLAWNLGRRTKLRTFNCSWCGGPFSVSYQPKRKYCSRTCSALAAIDYIRENQLFKGWNGNFKSHL